MIRSTNEVAGLGNVRHRGGVHGVTVHAWSVLGNFLGGIRAVSGGGIGACLDLAETTRAETTQQETFDHMRMHASQAGFNAIVGMHGDANDAMDGITEILFYGTAVWVASDGARGDEA